MFERLGEDDDGELYNWSTDKEVQGIYSHTSPVVKLLREVKFLGQSLKYPLRLPLRDPVTGNPIVGEDGLWTYDGGIASFIGKDGRVRTHFYPAETGRCSSSKPNCQNFCYDHTTELLTQDGWVRFDALTGNENIAQYWPDGHVDFVHPTAFIKQHYAGDMLRITTKKQIDLLVTPNHRCLLRHRKTHELQVVRADAFKEDWQHIAAGTYAGGTKTLSPAQVAWLCAVQADGSYTNSGAIVFGFSRPRKITRLKETLGALGMTYTTGSTSKIRKATRIYVSGVQNEAWVQWAKGLLGPDKCFGPWLLEYSRATLDCFADEVFHWDGGFSRKDSYASSNRKNADWVQILWSLSGKRSHFRDYHNGLANSVICHIVESPPKKQDYALTTNVAIDRVPWDGPVYCVTVPSGLVMVRRNGKVSVSGNSSGREGDYRRLLKEQYPFGIRSIFKAEPGHVIVKVDIKSAELLVVAQLSRDKQMIEDVERALLPEDHPDHVDMHSMTAIRAFKLNCAPTKKAIKAVGGENMRKAAKNQKFGRLYKRGITALVRQCHEEGVDITEAEMTALVQADEAAHPGVVAYLEAAEARVLEPGWITNPFGRHRRAGYSEDNEIIEATKRQFRNFNIQSTVAEVVDKAMWGIYQFRQAYRGPHSFKFRLQVHDELQFMVPIPSLEWMADEVLPLIKQIEVPVTDFDGRPTGAPPFHVDIDTSVYLHWGEAIAVEQGLALGIPERFLGHDDD